MRDYDSVLNALQLDLKFVPPGDICSDWSLREIRGHMLRKSFFKKLSPKRKPNANQIASAIEKFKRVNSGLTEDFEFVPELLGRPISMTTS